MHFWHQIDEINDFCRMIFEILPTNEHSTPGKSSPHGLQ